MSPTVIYRDGRPSKTYKMNFKEAVYWASHLWADGYTGSAEDAKYFMLEAASNRIVDMIFKKIGVPRQTFEEDIDLFYKAAGEIFRNQIHLAADAYENGNLQTAKEFLTEIMPVQEEVEAVFRFSQELCSSLSKKESFLEAVAKIIGQWKSDS